MTDRELLELAAKAAGLKVDREWQSARDLVSNPDKASLWIFDGSTAWNPLKNDGDALRLAVKLNIEFAYFDDIEQVNAGVYTPGPESWDCMTPYNGDKQAAVRRAITRAAAEIGKAMP